MLCDHLGRDGVWDLRDACPWDGYGLCPRRMGGGLRADLHLASLPDHRPVLPLGTAPTDAFSVLSAGSPARGSPFEVPPAGHRTHWDRLCLGPSAGLGNDGGALACGHLLELPVLCLSGLEPARPV